MELQQLLQQERELHFSSFNSHTAWRIGTYLVEKALKERLPIAIDITITNRTLFHWAADEATINNEFWIERKKRSVYRFNHSTLYLGRELALKKRSAYEEHYVDEKEYAFHGGGFPIIIDGVGVVGAIIISGLTQEEDHDLAVEALRTIKV